MSLIQSGLKAVASYDKTTHLPTTAPLILRYADKGEVVGSVINDVMTERMSEDDTTLTGVMQGLTRVTERQTKSKSQIMHHNCRVNFKMPNVTGTQALGSAKVAMNKLEDTTLSVSLAAPVRIQTNPEYVTLLGAAVDVQLAAIGAAYKAALADLLVQA